MSKLHLENLQIHNFRGFQALQIEKLGRVNLIVGRNSVGKSSVLEALSLYANRGSLKVIQQILTSRGEYKSSLISNDNGDSSDALYSSIKHLFYGRKDRNGTAQEIIIGPSNNPAQTLSLKLDWFTVEEDETGLRKLQQIAEDAYDLYGNPIPGLLVQNGSQRTLFRLDRAASPNQERIGSEKVSNILVPANSLDQNEIDRLWANIALTPLENEVTKALQIVSAQVERVNVVADPNRLSRSSTIVKMLNQETPVPLRSLGDGMNRVLGITLALVNAKEGFLLVDEIENGIHYTVLYGLWKLILELARRLDVQVFATTHSDDCIRAFQKASSESEEEGLLIRLENRDNKVRAVLVDEKALEIVVDRDIEVR